MKYDHTVKVNGKYYPAGAEVPDLDAAVEQSEKVEAEDITETTPQKRGRKPAGEK